MVDNRSAGFYGIGGSFNFKSGDISGTAAKNQDDKMGSEAEYFAQEKSEDEENNNKNDKYVDRSAQLRATLNSLAMMNVANVINVKKQQKKKRDEEIDESDIQDTSDDELELSEDEFINPVIKDSEDDEDYEYF